jgi:O-antigen ligase/tetratricopeptide (TPR) repeat protein
MKKDNRNQIKETIAVNFDFAALFYISVLLVIDFLPYYKSMEIIYPQFLYIALLNLAAGLFFYFNYKSVFQDTILVLKRSYVFVAYFFFLFFCTFSLFYAKNCSLSFIRLSELIIVFCVFINGAVLLRNKLHLFYKIVFIVGISAFVQSWQELYNFIRTASLDSVGTALASLKGNTGNINILAASLMIKTPFLFIGIAYFKGKKKYFLLLTLFLVALCVFLTAARTALISLILVFCIYTFYYLKTNSFAKSSFYSSIVILLSIVFSLIMANVIFNKVKNNERYSSIENRIGQISTKDASANARLTYWNNTIKLAKESPILGIGLGNYEIESIPLEKEFSDGTTVSLHSHNDFLEIFAETGLFNALIYLSIFGCVFFINLKRVLQNKDETSRTIAVTAFMIVIIYGMDAMFNFPMYRPTMQIFSSLGLALTLVNTPFVESQRAVLYFTKQRSVLLVVISVISFYFAYEGYKASNLEYLIKTDNIDNNENGVLSGDEVVNRLPKYPNVFGTSESFYEYAGIYYIREKKYEKAMKCFFEASKINPYSGRINFYKHIIFLNKGNTDSAYVYAKEAYYLRPRNLQFYQTVINLASNKKDTTEIMKAHRMFSSCTNSAEEWNIAAIGLQNSNYSRNKLIDFISQGLKVIPNDSILLKRRNDFLITNYIIDGHEFAQKGQLNKTLECYEKGLKLDSKNIYIMQNLGFYYYNLSRFGLAIEYFKKALLSPGLSDGKTEYYLGMCYLNAKDFENACKYLDTANTYGYSNSQQLIDLYCK